ncbi:MAG: glycosyltransferase family 39 protein [Acidobacteria bacterium]|nr:glycosyltransferase family 39 protein [Acidobacteriota bacterium]
MIDHDESTYLVIADEINEGKLLYTDVTDIKPVGIFYITAAFLKIFGNTIFGFRLFGAVVIGLTSFLLYKIKLSIGHGRRAALASGILYIFFISIWTYYGVSVNTEHFFNLFTALAVYILFSSRSAWRFPLAGIVIGTGFLIKIVVVFDITAIFLFLLITDWIGKKLTPRKLGLYFISGVLFLVPFALVNLAFYLSGHFDDFRRIHYSAFFNYAQEISFIPSMLWILEFILKFLPIFVFFFWSLLAGYRIRGYTIREKLFAGLWSAFCLASVLIPGKLFDHYFIQLMLPVSLLAGNFFSPEVKKPRVVESLFSRKTGYALLAFLIAVNLFIQKKAYYDEADCARERAKYIKEVLHCEASIYTSDSHQIIYFLLDALPPTRYVHPSLIFNKEHNKTLEIDGDKELRAILDKRPRCIITRDTPRSVLIAETLKKDYRLDQYFRDCPDKIYTLINP